MTDDAHTLSVQWDIGPAGEGTEIYKHILALALDALGYKKLPNDARGEIIRGMSHLHMGIQGFEHGNPNADRLMLGALLIGSNARVSESAKKYWDKHDHEQQGVKTGAKARERAEIWRGAARQRIAKEAEKPKPLSASLLAKTLKKEEGKPGSITYPEVEYLTKFIRKERKAGVKLGKTLRLVQR